MTLDPGMRLWQGLTDPEPDSERWHQRVQPYKDQSDPGVVLIGFAGDAGVARCRGRTGAASGPTAIRQALAPLAWHRQGPVFETGNVICAGNDLEAAQAELAERLTAILSHGHLPIVLGGSQELAYGSWSGLARHIDTTTRERATIGIINVDAHLDLHDPQHGHSSETAFAQIAEQCQARDWPFRYACLGVSRAINTRALFQRADTLEVLVREDRDFMQPRFASLASDVQRFIEPCDHLYLSIDLDVLPATEAPGVSTPTAHGVPLMMLEPLLELIRDSGKLRLADIAELNPEYDIDARTAKTAARLVHLLTLND